MRHENFVELMPVDSAVPEAEVATSAADQTKRVAGPLQWRAFTALIILPVLWAAFLIVRFGVNVPYYDQWVGMAPVFESMEAGALRPGDFTVQHNEHRMLIPRLVFFAAGLLSKWDTRVEMFLTLAVLLVIAASFWKLLGTTGWRAGPRTYALFALIGVFVLTPLQQQNLLNGFQFHFVLPLAFVVAGIWSAVSLRHPWNYVASACLAAASTFSMASGLLSWFLLVLALVFRQDHPARRTRWLAFWVAAFALCVAAYFAGFRSPPMPATGPLRHPGAVFYYFLVYVGTPFACGALPRFAAAVGAGLIALVGGALWTLWRWRKESQFFNRALPWMLVSATGLAHGLLTAAGRFQVGADKAMETRYVTYAVMIPIGLLVIGALICAHLADKRLATHRWMAPICMALGSILFVFHGLAVCWQFPSWSVEKHYRLFVKAAVQTVGIIDEPQIRRYLSAEPARLRPTVQALARLGYLHPLPLTSPSIATIGDAATKGETHYGVLDQSGQSGDRMAVMGWAILPHRLQPADAVLLTYDDEQGIPTIFALVEVIDPRPDVAAMIGAPDLTGCGWRSMFAPSQLPAGATTIKAWAYDAEHRRAWRLTGSASVRR